MVGIDTNVLVRFIINDHPALGQEARDIINRAKPGSLLLDRVIIAELGYVLRANYACSKAKIAMVYESLLAADRFTIPDRDVVSVAVSLFKTELPLSFEDCWLLALKQSGQVEKVATFDKPLLANRAK